MAESEVNVEKPSSEEDDLKDRSNKRVKPNGLEGSEIIMDDDISEGDDPRTDNKEEGMKPSKEHCPEGLLMIGNGGDRLATVEHGESRVERNHDTEMERNHDAENVGIVNATNPHLEENKLTKDDTCYGPEVELYFDVLQQNNTGFGPWMIAKNKSRRRFSPKSVERNISEKNVDPSGSCYEALQTNVDSTGDVVVELTSNGVGPSHSNLGHVHMQKPKQPKQTPASKTAPRQGKQHQFQSSKPKKEKEIWNNFMEEKTSSSVMNQFVINPSDEVLAFAQNLLGRRNGDGTAEATPKPPDILVTADDGKNTAPLVHSVGIANPVKDDAREVSQIS
ncbi:hypothetical protein RIF29_39270 [Crotalaria pallida]|uniref:Uncharacterized protein n=1 Tax=Crotalaria pallida TaxID=3830 RepID=A0AAN9E3X1_CROPI